MCGRYYIDDSTASEIEKLIQQTDKKLRQDSMEAVRRITERDIYPAQRAPVLAGKDKSLCCVWQKWGYPGFQEKQVVFNARCESVMEKTMFRDSIRHNRMVIPAAWFYEWNRRKEKNTFYRKDSRVLYMAGCCRRYEDGRHFVILTTGANASMEPVHDRMPLILEQKEISPWILDDEKAQNMLCKTPCLLERRSDYEQLTLF